MFITHGQINSPLTRDSFQISFARLKIWTIVKWRFEFLTIWLCQVRRMEEERQRKAAEEAKERLRAEKEQRRWAFKFHKVFKLCRTVGQVTGCYSYKSDLISDGTSLRKNLEEEERKEEDRRRAEEEVRVSREKGESEEREEKLKEDQQRYRMSHNKIQFVIFPS